MACSGTALLFFKLYYNSCLYNPNLFRVGPRGVILEYRDSSMI
jgi:hypothetical protein